MNESLTELKELKDIELEWKRRDGEPIVVRCSGHRVDDKDGGPGYFEVFAEDVTERRTLERQLRMAQKMEAIGRLSGGIAHDFNNLLGVIIGYSGVLKKSLDPALPSYEHAVEIEKAGRRAASLTRQLLAFSRQQVLTPCVLNLNSLVSDMEKMLPRLLGEDINVSLSLGPEIGNVKADQSQIEQVIMNLAVNARDAMPSGGKLKIETANVELDQSYTRDHPGSKGCWPFQTPEPEWMRRRLRTSSSHSSPLRKEEKAPAWASLPCTEWLNRATGMSGWTARREKDRLFRSSSQGTGMRSRFPFPSRRPNHARSRKDQKQFSSWKMRTRCGSSRKHSWKETGSAFCPPPARKPLLWWSQGTADSSISCSPTWSCRA